MEFTCTEAGDILEIYIKQVSSAYVKKSDI